MPAKTSHPKEQFIDEDCYIEIEISEKAYGEIDGYNVYVVNINTEEIILDEWEPDFDWAWQTAKYYSKKYDLEIIDKTPY